MVTCPVSQELRTDNSFQSKTLKQDLKHFHICQRSRILSGMPACLTRESSSEPRGARCWVRGLGSVQRRGHLGTDPQPISSTVVPEGLCQQDRKWRYCWSHLLRMATDVLPQRVGSWTQRSHVLSPFPTARRLLSPGAQQLILLPITTCFKSDTKDPKFRL